MKARYGKVEYSIDDLISIKSRVFAKIAREIDLAFKNDDMEYLLDKYGIVLEEEERMPINVRTYKILVIGELAGSKKDYQMTLKKMGIDSNNVEFIDYDQVKRFNASRLEYSTEYSDIIYGPTPHKVSEMGDTSSLLALIEKNPMKYPRLVRCHTNTNNGKLKISISGFKDAIRNTYYYDNILGL